MTTPGSARAAVVGAAASEPRLGAAYSSSAQAEPGADFWSQLVNARTSDQLCQGWLGILCQWVPGTQAGLLLLQEEGDRYAPAAVWPDRERDMSHYSSVAQEALTERRGVLRNESGGMVQCAYPLLGAEVAYGVVVLHVMARGDIAMRDALRFTHWGAGWLVGLFDKRNLIERDRRLGRSALLQDLLLGALSEVSAEESGRWIVNRLVEALPCRQAVLGYPTGASVELANVSGSAGFEPRTNLLAAARDALQEALEWGETRCFPAGNDTGVGVSDALAGYCREAGASGAVVLPLSHQGRNVGVLLVDADTPFDPVTRGFLETLALALAPCIDVQRRAGRGLLEHTRSVAGTAVRAVFGPRAPGMKLIAAIALLLFGAAALINTEYRVRSPALIEGLVQRAAVAPYDGYIAAAAVRAGDPVRAGDLLARMDDRDLKLEEAKAAADAELADRKLREALGRGDAAAVRVGEADAQQADAALALVREKHSRAEIKAPFDGRIVSGDWSQQLGAPIEQGHVLFEIAPMDAWRVVLKIDERDIVQLREGQRGELVLAGLPGEHFQIQVIRIAPVAQPEDGRNSFRVEARMVGGSPSRIQPGMEGVGKVAAGEHSLLWIGFHRVFDWVRYTLWTVGL